jgi:CRISPR type III-A-associated RAMP protein Csm5
MINKPFIEIPLKIETLSPVHIGMGEDYYPTDYVIEDGKLYFIDKNKFTMCLKENSKWDEFCNICKTTGNKSIFEIRRFIKNNFNKSCSSFEVAVSKDVEGKYNEEINSFNPNNQLIINRIYRTGIEQEVVIPGSSVKGAFMTALLNSLSDNKKKDDLDKSGNFKHDIRNNNANTIGQMISFSDFYLLKGQAIIDNAKNIKKFGAEKDTQANVPAKIEHFDTHSVFLGNVKINLLNREFSKKYSEIIGQNPKNFDKSFFEFLNNFYYKEIYNFELKKFNYSQSKFEIDNLLGKSSIIKLGKYSGAFAVTVHPLQVSNIKIMQKRGEKRKDADCQTTIWTINNLPMAWCKVSEISPEQYREDENIIKQRRKIAEEQKLKDSKKFTDFIQDIVIEKQKELEIIALKQKEKEDEEQKQLEEQAKLDNMSEIDRLCYQIRNFEINQQNEAIVSEEYKKIDCYNEKDKVALAKAMKEFFIKGDKWNVKEKQIRQFEKVKKIKAILNDK